MTEETNNPNALVNQAGDFAKKQTMGLLSLLLQTLKKSFSYQGRATRKEFWTFTATAFLVNILLVLIGAGLCRLAEWFEYPVITILCVLNFCLIFPGISVAVRRLHDLNLTGFWLWYLSPLGLAIVFVVNVLDLDNSCNSVIEKVNKFCTSWVAWLLLPIFWWIGAPFAQLLLFLYKGKDAPNDFGPSPY